MTYTAIRVNNISKRYRIGGNPAGYKTLRESINQSFRLPWAKSKHQDREAMILWALKDVSFEVKKGEVLGVIGRNGAGKSTLLKILSRVTKPTMGEVRLRGRVGSLLEVGTGFHPELTGRENIFLNGSILGLKKVEIENKFDEIVTFAEIEKFLDTQVKFYSSGMYMRLAFSVAAHLEPEILIIDEVLAVGDAAFQKKCLGMMGDVANGGRTVLFVSHNMSAIGQLCNRAIVLEDGKVVLDSKADIAVIKYLSSFRSYSGLIAKTDLLERQFSNWGNKLRISMVQAMPENGSVFGWWEPLRFLIEVQVMQEVDDIVVGAGIEAFDGTRLSTSESQGQLSLHQLKSGEKVSLTVALHKLALTPGTYRLAVGVRSGLQDLDYLPGVIIFEVGEIDLESSRIYEGRTGFGPVCNQSIWERRGQI
jgi:lipopolysaccharide transport system ATP-binding protein